MVTRVVSCFPASKGEKRAASRCLTLWGDTFFKLVSDLNVLLCVAGYIASQTHTSPAWRVEEG